MLKEFRDFISRGNVLDLAVAVVMGTAFTAIVNSLVNDVIMPIIGMIIGGVDFTSLSITIGEAQILYGSFIQAVINFLLIAFVVFLLVKAINEAQRRMAGPKVEEKAAPPEPSAEEKLLMEIRDLLKKRTV
ncbi:MAG: large-conductance mechanosensitive channel protein MscL [Chloroflexota bacterium]|jgi:large conductance mechanosensitive channel|nr:large-conductance mechanosensitive channel protein MscL [Chloroflexota bacterium]